MFDKDAWDAMHAQVQRDYADYLAVLEQEAKKQNVCGPHCDAYVLHRPGHCEFCDHFPALQVFRVTHRIAFTGYEPKDNERPCPATLFRPAETIHRWHGNRPHHSEDEESKEASNEQQDYLHWSSWE
jgi:hypothetical protein